MPTPKQVQSPTGSGAPAGPVMPPAGMAPIQGLQGPLSGIGTVPAPPGVNGIAPGTPLSPAGLAGVQGPPTSKKTATAPAPNALDNPLMHYLASMGGSQGNSAQNYMGAFQNALGSARGDIAQQLAGALSDIKANQAYAQQALGTLPGQINQSYNTANALMANGQHVAQAGMNAPGLNAPTAANTGGSLNQYMAPERAAIAGEKAGEMANVPLLATGIQQAGSQEAAAANNAALSDYGNLAQQQAQLAGQAQIAAMNQGNNQSSQNAQNIFSLISGALNNKYTLSQIAAQNANSGGNATYGGLTQGQVAQTIASPDYATAVQAVQGGQYKSLADLQKAYPTNPALWQTIASQYGLK